MELEEKVEEGETKMELKEVQKVNDQGALNGLRGLAALHITVFHTFFFCQLNLHLYANVSSVSYSWELHMCI